MGRAQFFSFGVFFVVISSSVFLPVCMSVYLKTDSLPKGEVSMMKMKKGGREDESAQRQPC